MKKILISGYHGFGNCGDEAILWAMVNNLKSIYPDLEIVALSKQPQETTKVYGIKSINRFNLFSIFYHLLRSNLLISGGGSLLQDVTSTRSLIYYLSIIFIAKLLGKPVCVYANGIGPIKKCLNKFLTKIILNKVNTITLRDSISKNELSQLGIVKPRVEVTADPVFTLQPSTLNNTTQIFEDENIEFDKPLIGISIREWKTKVNYEETIAQIADNIIEKYNCNVLFIPMHRAKDLKTIKTTQSLMKNKSFTFEKRYSVQEYMNIIDKLSVIISMRLHTLIFAAVQKIPMIGIVYDPKVQIFLDLVEQPSVGSIENLDSNKLYELLDNALNNKQQISQNLEKHINELSSKAELNDIIVKELLEK